MSARRSSYPYSKSVFINCPFTDDYNPLFNAILFTVIYCGYYPRSAMEVVDSGQIRLQKIEKIIAESQYGIHDLSNMQLDNSTGLPRFNMPFELGLFLGAKRFGDDKQRRKRTVILDIERYRYMKALSDISGQDIQSHGNQENLIIKKVRNWLNSNSKSRLVGASYIHRDYNEYKDDFLGICKYLKLDPNELPFSDKWETVTEWMRMKELI